MGMDDFSQKPIAAQQLQLTNVYIMHGGETVQHNF